MLQFFPEVSCLGYRQFWFLLEVEKKSDPVIINLYLERFGLTLIYTGIPIGRGRLDRPGMVDAARKHVDDALAGNGFILADFENWRLSHRNLYN